MKGPKAALVSAMPVPHGCSSEENPQIRGPLVNVMDIGPIRHPGGMGAGAVLRPVENGVRSPEDVCDIRVFLTHTR